MFLREPVVSRSALFEELAAADEALLRTKKIDRPRPNETIVRELGELFQNPWFRRVWVLQEVYAKSSVKFMCNTASFSYTVLWELCLGYNSNNVFGSSLPLALHWVFRAPEEFSTPQFNLWNRLYLSRNFLATDPRDRIFALRSLMDTAQTDMDALIDYTQSMEECFIRVATFLLPVLGLQLLAGVRHPHDREMPSWVPDWSQNLPLHYYTFSVEYPGASGGQFMSQFGVSNQQKHALRSFHRSSNELCLELLTTGCRYAQVVENSQLFHFVDLDDAKMQMKRLYCTFIDLGHHVNPEEMGDNSIVLAHLGKAISDSKH